MVEVRKDSNFNFGCWYLQAKHADGRFVFVHNHLTSFSQIVGLAVKYYANHKDEMWNTNLLFKVEELNYLVLPLDDNTKLVAAILEHGDSFTQW